MTIIVDLVIVAIMAICIIIGYVRGLTGSLIKILSFVLSLSILFSSYIGVFALQPSALEKTDVIENSTKNAQLGVFSISLQRNLSTCLVRLLFSLFQRRPTF